VIDFKRVTFRYPNAAQPAISALEWCVPEGAICLVVGPSGSGKSTLARCVNGLVPHFHGGQFSGVVHVAGLDTRRHSTAELSRHVGFVAQVPESQTVTDRVEDEIAFGPENLGLGRSELRIRVEETIDLLGLNALRGRRLETLSGGERQRVVIAASMAMRPEILVLDEPTSQLDPVSSEEILSVLRKLNEEMGTTVMLVEHRLDRALGMSDQVLLLGQDGSVEAAGETRAVLSRLPQPPPLVRVAQALHWDPPPLTVRDARRFRGSGQPNTYEPLDRPSGRPAQPASSISFERVSFDYEKRPVLDRLSVHFQPGTLTALMGRNGSGKTTLLKLAMGLVRPRSGRVWVNGRDIAKLSTVELAQSVGYLPQNAGTLLFNDTVEDEVRFTLRCRGRTDNVGSLLERLDLTRVASRNPLDLSGGERLRAAIAAVLAGRPRVLLLDEPTRGVDAALKERLGRLLRELTREGMTVVLATHDVDMVADFADRMVVLGEGDVIADGAPHDVMPGSLIFSTQINRVFGGRILTAQDVLDANHADGAGLPRGNPATA
jgi:energy-coupling factor transport system ATP-binding protein